MSKLVLAGLEGIKKGLKDNGFKEDGDDFIREDVSYDVMSINGQEIKKEKRKTVTFRYIGDGGVLADDDSSDVIESLYYFDLIVNDNMMGTIGVRNFDEFINTINI